MSMYLLDTNICIYAITGRNPIVIDAIKKFPAGNIALSTVTLAELEYGASKSMQRERNRLMLIVFASPFRILPFDIGDVEVFGKMRAYLERTGTPIGPYDLQIAAQAISRNYVLVTNNEREFKRVPGLRIENWSI